MRGYNQLNNSTSSNLQDSFLTKNIEDYTIKDCEDFLAKYPMDLDADKVRKRLELLRPKKGESETAYFKQNKKQRQNPESTKNASSKKIYSKPNKSLLDYTLDECLEFINHNPNDPDVELVKGVLAEHRKRIRQQQEPEFFKTVLGKLVLSALLVGGVMLLAFFLAAINLPKLIPIPLLGFLGLKAIWKWD